MPICMPMPGKHDLARLFRLNTNVASMDRRQGRQDRDGRLTLEAAGKSWTEDVDFVAICTGQFSDKNVLTHPGQEDFEASGGQVMHSSEYTDPELARGKHVVVLGGSKSATDLVVNASKNGAKSVTMVYREPVWRVPYFVGGINFKRLLYMRAQEQQFNSWGAAQQAKPFTAFKPLIWANFRGLETLLKFQLNLKKWDMVPDIPIEKDASCSLPIVTPGLFEGFESGTIRPVRGTFTAYEPGHVVLSTGEKIPCDLSVLAVGWKLGIPYLAKEYRDKLVEGRPIPGLPALGEPGSAGHGIRRLQFQLLHGAVGGDDCQLAGALCRRSARQPAERRGDAAQHRRDAGLAPKGTAGSEGLWRALFGAVSFPAFRRIAGRHGR